MTIWTNCANVLNNLFSEMRTSNSLKLKYSAKFSRSIRDIASSLSLKFEHGIRPETNAVFLNNNLKISVAVIDLSGKKPILGGYKMNDFIYPASLYKVFVATEVLRQVENKRFNLDKKIIVSTENVVDKKKQIPYDKRKLLKTNDRVSIEYLLELMLQRSDNTAANCLIDLVGREKINKNIIKKYHWLGSEVTRKFLSRESEKPKWKKAPVTLTCGRHIAEFFFLIEKEKMINKKVSLKLKEILSKSGHFMAENLISDLPEGVKFYRKGGWFEKKLKDGSILKSNCDAGIVKINNIKYVIVVLTGLKTKNKKDNFPMTKLSEKIYELILNKSTTKR